MQEQIRCPYCQALVRMTDVDNDDGCCAECGAPLMGSSIFSPEEYAAQTDEELLEDD